MIVRFAFSTELNQGSPGHERTTMRASTTRIAPYRSDFRFRRISLRGVAEAQFEMLRNKAGAARLAPIYSPLPYRCASFSAAPPPDEEWAFVPSGVIRAHR